MTRQIRLRSHNFSRSEKKVADYVVQQPMQVLYSSLNEVAEQSGVGEATVLRFCRKLDCQGFQDFRIKLAQSEDTMESRNDTLAAIPANLEETLRVSYAQAVEQTLRLCDWTLLQAVAEHLLAAERVLLVGSGMSGVTAQDGAIKLWRLGVHAIAATDPHAALMQVVTCQPERDLVVGISVSGATKDTVETLRLAKSRGIGTVAMTSYRRSPISTASDWELLTARRSGPLQGGEVPAKLSQLLIVDLLCATVQRLDPERTQAQLKATAQAVALMAY